MRPATYESESEAKVLQRFWRGRSGTLENTVFCLVAPDGKTKLSRAGRSPRMAYDGPEDLAKSMASIVERYPSKKSKSAAPLPTYPSVRLALNVASCDARPLVVVANKDAKERERLAKALAELAWSKEFIGRYHYALAESLDELAPLTNAPKQGGVMIVAPGDFGLEGKVLVAEKAKAKAKDLTKLLESGLSKFKPKTKNPSEHTRKGVREGVEWESEIPVTDPDEAKSRRGRRDR